MQWLSEVLRRLMFLFRRGQFHRDLDEEMADHVHMKAGELSNEGIPPEEAQCKARQEFGNALLLREKSRDAWGFAWLETFLQDIRYGARQLRRNPGFTIVAVTILALGIGANTAIFTLVDAVILRTLPVRRPGQLVILKWSARRWPSTRGSYYYGGCPGAGASAAAVKPAGCSFSYPVFNEIELEKTDFSGVFAFTGSYRFDTSFGGRVGSATAQFVSGGFFQTLSERSVVGRLLVLADDATGAAPAVVLSYGYWQSRFGGDPSIVGKTLFVNRAGFTIVGVSASRFLGLETGIPVDLWIPLGCQPSVFPYFPKKSDAAGIWLDVGARLKPRVPILSAESAVNLIFARRATSDPGAIFKAIDDPRVELVSLSRGLATLRQRFSDPLFVLIAAVGIMLLIACANLAGMMLARSTTRQREIAVRLAIGAGRRRLMRQLFTEIALLATGGSVVGVLLAFWGANSLASFLSTNFYTRLKIDTKPDLHILAFTLVISVLSTVLVGCAPAVFGSRVELMPALKEAPGHSASAGYAGRQRSKFSGVLIVAQVALSILVLAGAGLLIRTLVKLETMNVGFEKHNLLLFDVDTSLSGAKGPQLQVLSRNLRERFASLPGVSSASYSMFSLLSGANMTTMISLPGGGGARRVSVEELRVGPKFFHTMRIPLLAGRAFAPGDFTSEAKPQPIIVNQALTRRYFGNRNPLALRLGESATAADWQIVGIVADAKYSALRAPIAPTVYLPLTASLGGPAFELRTEADPRALITLVRNAAEKVNKNLLLTDVTTQSKQIDKTLYQERLVARLAGALGLLALVLAGIGLYGLLAYQVACRTHEIGVRMALGAQRGNVLRMVIGQGLKLALIGVAVGIAGALTRFLSSLLYGVRPTDPLTLLGVSLLMVCVGLLACYIPARRATKVDPVIALRCE
jgi:predicted permease